MHKRIRYMKPDENGWAESRRRFSHPTNGARFIVAINEKELKWRIYDDNTTQITKYMVHEGTAVNTHQCKIAIRKALEALGINLEKETRNINHDEVV